MTIQFAEASHSDSELEIGGSGWEALTWDDLRKWAGQRNVERGRFYQQHGHVRDLIAPGAGRLTATVVGNHWYQTSVWLVPEKSGCDSLHSHCTCPVGHKACKHAVAVIAQHLESLTKVKNSPATGGQHHHDASRAGTTPVDDNSGANRIVPVVRCISAAPGAPAESAAESPAEPPLETQRSEAGKSRQGSSWDGSLKDNLRLKSHEELVELVCSLLQGFSELRADVREQLGVPPRPPAQ